ncbi:origin recognition complex subunit 3 N-terminus-domain-containing protein [Glomus cerebriforme]|uniref:Origin recognition complex subunit 3 n=1 Tax=Glomus cerebriforme TaxID=658196 RepID=A0A397TCC5_9GLOM|nr:origin recognition complex subunit 3 N-terminus-domain-containing protein [Glomus cerebriforme]
MSSKDIEVSRYNIQLKPRLFNKEEYESANSGFTEILFDGREPIEAAEIRYDEYERNIKKVDCKIDNFHFQMNEFTVNDLHNFIEDTYDEGDTNQFLKSRYDTSHEKFFESFVRDLSRKQQIRAVLIDSTCVLELEDLVTYTIRFFRCENGYSLRDYLANKNESNYNDDEEETVKDEGEMMEDFIDEVTYDKVYEDNNNGDMDLEEESDESKDETPFPIKDVIDIESLVQWYESNAKIFGLRSLPKLVIVIYNFDLLDPIIAEKYIYILDEYKGRIPIVLLLGISSVYRGVDAIHEGYSYSVERLLRFKEFHLSDNIRNFDELITRFFISNHFDVKVGIKPYNFLNNIYGRLKVSLKYFEFSIKHIINYYFYSNPLSILTTIDLANVSSRIDLMNEYHLEMIRMQLSFRRFVEKFVNEHNQPTIARCLLEDDDFVKSILPIILRDMRNYHQDFAVAFEIVHSLQKYVNPKLIKAKCELYSYALTYPGLGEHAYVQHLLFEFKKLKSRDLKQFLDHFQSVLEKNLERAECAKSEIPKLREFHEQLEALLQFSIKSAEKNKKRKQKIPTPIQNETYSTFTLKPGVSSSDRFTNLITSIFEYLQVFFKEKLRHYSTNTLYEIFYWEESYSLESLFLPKIRQSIVTALGRPKQYLNCKCCPDESDDDDDEIDPAGKISYTQDDRCILYKLLIGFGKFIHMNDLLESFENIIKKENTNITDDETKERFFIASESLKVVGVIADAKGKKGYIRKMVW